MSPYGEKFQTAIICLLCLDDLCRYSTIPFSLSFVLHLQKKKSAFNCVHN